jgi:radical SAM superfamily enzyme YgiQ (UPF0313 family)
MKTKIGLVQINNSFSGQNYFPYSVGLLQVYAEKYLKEPDKFEFLLPIYSRISVEKAIQHLECAEIILFSVYVWNVRLSLKIAEEIKSRKPDIMIVFGGPHVPNNAENFLLENPFIDIACHKEGESIICPLLENAIEKEWDQVPSISYINEENKFIQNPLAKRIKSLNVIPSPYLEGVFEPLIAAFPDERWLVMWETNRGCPFSCTFCDWGSATQAKVNQYDLDRLYKEIDWISQKRIEFIFCCDANFGLLKRDYDIAKYVANNKSEYGYPQALSVQNTKNSRERAYLVQKMLSDNGLNKGVTLSAQSMDEETLKNVKRSNISLSDYKELQHRFTKDKIETYNDMILGMPGETYDSFINGISTLISNGQHNRIQFGNLSILPNAEMGDKEYQKKFGMKIVESEIINIHGSLSEEEEVTEMQELVIATNSMPEADWIKTRAICWLSAFLHFDKVMQLPLILLNKVADLSFRELIEVFTSEKIEQFPLLTEIYGFFVQEAKKIQDGKAEYSESKKWLNIWWPADELQLIHLCTEKRLDQFYSEAQELLQLLLKEKGTMIPNQLLEETINLNKKLIKQPLETEDLEVSVSYNIWEFYQNHLIGNEIPIIESPVNYIIDRGTDTWSTWEEWCKKVIWYENKKGAYLYEVKGNAPFSSQVLGKSVNQIAGHY